MFQDELRRRLIELCAQTGALDARITRARASSLPPEGVHRAPLGEGAYLDVLFVPATGGPTDDELLAIERASRALRACGRRWELPLPVLGSDSGLPMRTRLLHRIEDFLRALADAQGAVNALVTVRGELVASARPTEELQRERIQFLLRQVDAAVARQETTSSHTEIEGSDFFATSFWYGACLIVFFDEPFSTDFVRHRARLVTRELIHLLPDLDDPPKDPAQVSPLPE